MDAKTRAIETVKTIIENFKNDSVSTYRINSLSFIHIPVSVTGRVIFKLHTAFKNPETGAADSLSQTVSKKAVIALITKQNEIKDAIKDAEPLTKTSINVIILKTLHTLQLSNLKQEKLS